MSESHCTDARKGRRRQLVLVANSNEQISLGAATDGIASISSAVKRAHLLPSDILAYGEEWWFRYKRAQCELWAAMLFTRLYKAS